MRGVLRLLVLSLLLLPSVINAFCFEDAGRAYSINPLLLESIARIESNLDPKAINRNKNGSQDIGLMQVNSVWVKALKLDPEELVSDPCYNAMVGAKILRQCIDRYGYAWEAVGCYNAADPAKRAGYSWKVFDELKTKYSTQPQDKRQTSDRSGQKNENGRLEITAEEIGPQPDKLHAAGYRYMLRTSNSELFFNVRETKLETR